jgi:nucleotide-binding universal stress UspA family protein
MSRQVMTQMGASGSGVGPVDASRSAADGPGTDDGARDRWASHLAPFAMCVTRRFVPDGTWPAGLASLKVAGMHALDDPMFSPGPGAAVSGTANLATGLRAVPDTIRRILLATDLTEASEVATDWAFALAERNGADLLVVSVIDPHVLHQESQRTGLRWDQVRDRRQAAAQELVVRGRPTGLSVTFLVWTGDPGESIVSAAEAEAADLIVVGTHGRGPIGRLFLGSVSQHVVRNAPCPVLVARPETARPR